MSNSSLRDHIERVLKETKKDVSSVKVNLGAEAWKRLDPKFHRHRSPPQYADEVTAVFRHSAMQFCFETHHIFRGAVGSICEALKHYGMYGILTEFNNVVDTSEVHIDVCMHKHCNMLAEEAMKDWSSGATTFNEQLLQSQITNEMKEENLNAVLEEIHAQLDKKQRWNFQTLCGEMTTLIKEVIESKSLGAVNAMVREIATASKEVLHSVRSKLQAWDGAWSSEMKKSMETCALHLQYECSTAVSRAQKLMVDCLEPGCILKEITLIEIFHTLACNINNVVAGLGLKIFAPSYDKPEKGKEVLKKTIEDEFDDAIRNITAEVMKHAPLDE